MKRMHKAGLMRPYASFLPYSVHPWPRVGNLATRSKVSGVFTSLETSGSNLLK